MHHEYSGKDGAMMESVQYCKSYEEYQRLMENDIKQGREPLRREVLDGVIYIVSMATAKHQDVVKNLGEMLGNFLKLKKENCKVLIAPFDVRLNYEKKSDEGEPDQIVQPDVFVSCKDKIIDGKFLAGAPEVVFEVLSENPSYDKTKKFVKYYDYGVKEYFMVDQYKEEVIKHVFLENDVETYIYKNLDDIFCVDELDFKLRVSDVFGYTERFEKPVLKEL